MQPRKEETMRIKKRLNALEERLARIEKLLSESESASPLVEDKSVPLSQVIKEYLWGKDEA